MLAHALHLSVAALVAFAIGALWYSPLLFAKAWIRANGYTPEKVAAAQANAARTYTGTFVALLLMAGVMHIVLAHLGADTAGRGAGWGFHLWLGIALPLGFIAHLYSDKSVTAFAIDTVYPLVYMTVMGAILGAW